MRSAIATGPALLDGTHTTFSLDARSSILRLLGALPGRTLSTPIRATPIARFSGPRDDDR